VRAQKVLREQDQSGDNDLVIAALILFA